MTGVRIEVPASSANLGPGFDTLAVALDITNVVTAFPAGDGAVLEGAEDPHRNLLCDAYRAWGAARGVTVPGVTFRMQAAIPPGRGLGSSAACILAGVASAAALAGSWTVQEVLDVALTLESHPDNLAAAALGGLTVALRDGGRLRALHLAREVPLGVALFVPDSLLPTAEARRCLPGSVALADAVFNVGRVAYLAAAAAAGCWDEMGRGMDDRLHQPYRAALVPGLATVIGAAREAGAYGASLSGAGPAVIALAPSGRAAAVAAAMQSAAERVPCSGRAEVTAVRSTGLTVTPVA